MQRLLKQVAEFGIWCRTLNILLIVALLYHSHTRSVQFDTTNVLVALVKEEPCPFINFNHSTFRHLCNSPLSIFRAPGIESTHFTANPFMFQATGHERNSGDTTEWRSVKAINQLVAASSEVLV